MQRIRFHGLRRLVAFEGGAQALLGPWSRLVNGWPWSVVDTANGLADECPVVRVTLAHGLYTLHSPFMPQPVREHHPLRAASHLAVDLIESWLQEHPQQLCLHGGAARFGPQLVVFPARARAGKSTLMARLAADGVPILTDDVLPTQGEGDAMGWSFGVAPRVRLPLPESASPAFRAFMAQCGSAVDGTASHLRLPPGQAPRFGDTAPIGAVVLLERSSEPLPASLTPAAAGDGLQALIRQNLAPAMAAEDMVERLHRLVLSVPCLRLRYHQVDDAAQVLQAAFADSAGLRAQAAPAAAPPAPTPGPAEATQASVREPLGPLRRASGVRERAVEGELFLVHPGTQGIHRLNAMASGIWHLLDEPTTAHDVVAVLGEAFPDEPPARIRADAIGLLDGLLAQGLITRDR